MKPTELRLGNYVDYKGESTIIKAIDFDELYENPPVYFLHGRRFESYKAIRLTEKWLLNFGFEKRDKDYIIGKLNLLNNRELRLFESSKKRICYQDYLHQIKYVHELQNLYYALNKKELVLAVAP